MKRIGIICSGSEWCLLPLSRSLGRKGYLVYCLFQSDGRYSINSKYIGQKFKISSSSELTKILSKYLLPKALSSVYSIKGFSFNFLHLHPNEINFFILALSLVHKGFWKRHLQINRFALGLA